MFVPRCRKCGVTKTADDFYHIRSSSDGLASNCKECAVKIANTTRKHFHEHPTVSEKVIATCYVFVFLFLPLSNLFVLDVVFAEALPQDPTVTKKLATP